MVILILPLLLSINLVYLSIEILVLFANFVAYAKARHNLTKSLTRIMVTLERAHTGHCN